MARMPLIGLTTYSERASWGSFRDVPVALAQDTYHRLVAKAGARPVLIPQVADDPEAGVADLIDALDGLVVIGGLDVGPERYGQERHPDTGRTDEVRDASDLALVRRALEVDLPLLAICRGHQVLNVALGGTLHQHVPEVVGHDDHQIAAGTFVDREVRCAPGTLTAETFGEHPIVSCSHHQAIDRLGEGLIATAWSVEADGAPSVVEAVERDASTFLLSVQWHPEESGDLRPFAKLVEAATERR
jgi:gamma-glutamyl-gamma-aminobutyrate hydrolase PuuD